MKAPIRWLLEGPAFVRYNALVALEGRPRTDREAKKAYAEMLADPLVARLVADVNDWEHQ